MLDTELSKPLLTPQVEQHQTQQRLQRVPDVHRLLLPPYEQMYLLWK